MTGNNAPGSSGSGTEPNPGPPLPPGACGGGPQRIWPLTPEQYLRTVKAVLPAAGDAGSNLAGSLAERTGFSNDANRLGMTEPYVSELLDAVFKLATAAVATPAQLAPCLGQATVTPACHKEFVAGFTARAFRRELAPAEVDELSKFLTDNAAGDLKAGLRRFLMYVFTSPSFAFRTELGAGQASGAQVPLTGFERASALSYFLTDGPPDPQLYAAARTGALADKANLETHARRLLTKATTATGFTKFFREFFDTEAAAKAEKEAMVFPQWTPALGAEMSRESDAFIEQVLWGEGAKFSTFFTADFSMINAPLASFYGVTAPGGAGFARTTFKPGERAGILTHAGAMAALAKGDDTDAVMRGRFVREALLCQHLPPPPDDVVAVPPPPDGMRTQRERLAQHSSDPSCATCHRLMDPLGLAFENYDGIGRYRKTDVGKTIDAAGVLTGAEPDGARFANAIELLDMLAKSPTVKRCFVSTAFRYAQGRPATDNDRCTIDRLVARFDASGGDLMDLAVGLATDDSFLHRLRQSP